jgi:hypothetical protein
MKTLIILLSGCCLFMIACQKSVPDIINRTNNGQDSVTNNTQDSIGNNAQDSIIRKGDTLTYEVLTTDPKGWFGIWNQADGSLTSNGLDSITFGNPNYLPTGWKYTFIAPADPFQAFISVASFSYSDDITANLYKNGYLIKSVKNDAMNGVAKLLQDNQADTLVGTAADPVLTYQVLVTEPDITKFESDSWIGHWMTPKAVYDDADDRLLSFVFAIPSGWKYSFKPEHLPFTMKFQGSPYTSGGGKVTINFFVNGQLVKSSAARDWIYDMEYRVQ